MDTKHIQSSRKRLYRRLVTAFGLWFGLLLFLMAATSLRRFTTPAVAPDDPTPAVTPNQAGAPPLAGVPSSTTQDHPADKAAKGAKQGTADADTARPVQPQKSSLRSDAAAAPVSTIRVAEAFGRLPLSFELNQGQTDRQVKFLAHGSGYTLFLTGHEAVLTLQATKKPERANARQGRLQMAARLAAAHREPAREARTMDVLRMKLVAANPAPKVEGAELLSGRSNYFVGKDSSQWHTSVPTYAQVRYQDVYPGVDLVYYGNQRQLEYDFVVAPGANPKAIKLSVVGASRPLAVDSAGNLVVHLRDGEVRFHRPVVYQNSGTDARQFVDGRFAVKGKNLVAFELGAYDPTRPVIIDPTLSYSTFLGGSGSDEVNAIAVDASGNAYVTGSTTSLTFPGSPTSLCGVASSCGSSNTGGLDDVFVAKINTISTSSLVYSAYLGGSGNDFGMGIAIDGSGDAYVTGSTDSSDFPQLNAIAGACVGTCLSGTATNAFVTEINAAGTSVLYSTRLGGSTSDSGEGIAVDSSGNAYIAGIAQSSDFPSVNQTPGTCVGTCGTASQRGFVAEVKPGNSGPTLGFSSLLGGSSSDEVFAVALDSSANIYVTGITTSSDFPTKNPIPAACNSTLPATCGTGVGEDAFVTELSAGGAALQFSTYLGGSSNDEGLAIAVDSSNSVYVTGDTSSTDFPKAGSVTGACKGNCSSGVMNAFVTKLKTDNSGLVYSTYLGGSGMDLGFGIAVDSSGDATVTGSTSSSDFPTQNALAGSCASPSCPTGGAGDNDAFVTQIAASGGAGTLSYSTYLGGSSSDMAFAVALDSTGNAYVAGSTLSDGSLSTTPFPTTANAAQTVNKGNGDGFVAKIMAGPVVSLSGNSLTFGSTQMGTTSTSQSVTLTNIGSAALNITSITASGDFVLVTTGTSCPYGGGGVGVSGQCTIDVAFKPTALGARAGSVSIADNAPGTPQSVSLSGTGIDTIPPTLTILANPSAIRLRNGSLVPVTVSGTITDSGSGVNPSSVTFNVVDEYGLVQPSGPVTLGAGGSYSFVVMLQASRLGSDADGRQYTITVSAKDNAGNLNSVSTGVTVLHDN